MGSDSDDVLHALLAGNDSHVEALADGHFAAVQAGQEPDVVAICCSDSRVPQVGMWDVDEPGTVFTPSNIGNQVWDEVDGETVVNGGLAYPIYHADTDAIAVVGHTGCGAVTAAYRVATGADRPGPRGVDKWVDLLVPVVEDALSGEAIDVDADDETVINRLVEYNVDRQIRFLLESDEIDDDVDVYGFVYDFQGIYGDDHGRAYLVNLNGETEPAAIAASIPAKYESAIRRLLD
ncbi:carbonic anhydrase [Halosolutus gelatinilyticus]|uniref:carbonic anhydrase n=1 Tax=Halosolutus gelatinilyticus TaxID=2931975 RepID=UPI001FF34D3A|nr:carbonic anhydrase [Halosolutus gelatinilyticus]